MKTTLMEDFAQRNKRAKNIAAKRKVAKTAAPSTNPVDAFEAHQKAAGRPEPLDRKRLVIVPDKGAPFAAYNKCVERAMAIIHASESGYTTAAYWSLGRALTEIFARHIWTAGMSFSAWCLSQDITTSRRSWAKGIADRFATIEKAAVVSLPDAIKAVKRMRAEERKKQTGTAAHRKVSAETAKKLLDATKERFGRFLADANNLTDKELSGIGQAILDFGAEVKTLVDRINKKKAA
jgi:hypothetical protein